MLSVTQANSQLIVFAPYSIMKAYNMTQDLEERKYMFALTWPSDINDLDGNFQLFKVSIDCQEDVELMNCYTLKRRLD